MQQGLKTLIENVQDYSQRNHMPDAIKLLIPQQYVSKIIGVGNQYNDSKAAI